jgi:RNA polymerase primary sigma factor
MFVAETLEREAVNRGSRTIGSPALARYLHEIGEHGVLTPGEEVKLSRKIQRARGGLVKLLEGTPPDCREFVFDGGRDQAMPPLRKRSLEELEACSDRLLGYARATGDSRLRGLVRKVERQSRALVEARDEMVRANLKFVVHIAKQYSRRGVPDPDLVQEGNIGLIKAVGKFEHERGYRFSTYAHWWIRQAISRALGDHTRTIRIPMKLDETVSKIRRAHRELAETLDREPTHDEIAARASVPVEQLENIVRVMHGL